jgi:hypothetical protein
VPSSPAIQPARADIIAADGPWVRRMPKSTTARPAAAVTTRAALEATSVS